MHHCATFVYDWLLLRIYFPAVKHIFFSKDFVRWDLSTTERGVFSQWLCTRPGWGDLIYKDISSYIRIWWGDDDMRNWGFAGLMRRGHSGCGLIRGGDKITLWNFQDWGKIIASRLHWDVIMTLWERENCCCNYRLVWYIWQYCHWCWCARSSIAIRSDSKLFNSTLLPLNNFNSPSQRSSGFPVLAALPQDGSPARGRKGGNQQELPRGHSQSVQGCSWSFKGIFSGSIHM